MEEQMELEQTVERMNNDLAEVVDDEPNVTVPSLIQVAIERNVTPEILEKLIDLENRKYAIDAKRKFDAKFSEMKAELPAIGRVKQGDKAKYAPIEEMQRRCDPIIFRHGFTYSWNENHLADGSVDMVLTISGYGHSEQTHKLLPPYNPDTTSSGKPIMNSLQAEGTRSSYGRRYTFINGFGLTVEDEDTDGNFDDGVTYADDIRALRAATNHKELLEIWRAMYSKHTGNQRAYQILQPEYDKRKKEIGK